MYVEGHSRKESGNGQTTRGRVKKDPTKVYRGGETCERTTGSWNVYEDVVVTSVTYKSIKSKGKRGMSSVSGTKEKKTETLESRVENYLCEVYELLKIFFQIVEKQVKSTPQI